MEGVHKVDNYVIGGILHYEKKFVDGYGAYDTKPTWGNFVNAIKVVDYYVGNYDD